MLHTDDALCLVQPVWADGRLGAKSIHQIVVPIWLMMLGRKGHAPSILELALSDDHLGPKSMHRALWCRHLCGDRRASWSI